jgi:hypothetical protein
LRIRKAPNGEWLFTVEGNKVRQAPNGEWLYTIEGDKIRRAPQGEWLYTIEGNKVRKAPQGEWLYTIEGDKIRGAPNGSWLYTIDRQFDGNLNYNDSYLSSLNTGGNFTIAPSEINRMMDSHNPNDRVMAHAFANKGFRDAAERWSTAMFGDSATIAARHRQYQLQKEREELEALERQRQNKLEEIDDLNPSFGRRKYRDLYNNMLNNMGIADESELREYAKKFRELIPYFDDAENLSEQCEQIADEKQSRRIAKAYPESVKKYDEVKNRKARTSSQYLDVQVAYGMLVREFESFGGYSDSSQYAAMCEKAQNKAYSLETKRKKLEIAVPKIVFAAGIILQICALAYFAYILLGTNDIRVYYDTEITTWETFYMIFSPLLIAAFILNGIGVLFYRKSKQTGSTGLCVLGVLIAHIICLYVFSSNDGTLAGHDKLRSLGIYFSIAAIIPGAILSKFKLKEYTLKSIFISVGVVAVFVIGAVYALPVLRDWMQTLPFEYME